MNWKTLTGHLLAASLLLAGCSAGPAASTPSPDAPTVTFTDDAGQEFTLEQPERVAALIGSFADIWITAGGQKTLVAAAHDTWTSFDLDLPDTVADLGAIKSPSTEILLESDPDLVLGSLKTEADKALQPTLEAQGIPVAYFDVSDFDDYLRMLKVCTDLTGDTEAYTTYGTDLQADIDRDIEFAAAQPSPTVLYLRATGSSVKAKNSKGSVLGEMLANLNTVNVADSDDSLLESLSMEAIMEADPDDIFLVYQGSDDTKARAQMDVLLQDPAWQTLRAVQNDRVHVMDPSLYNLKPNARWAEAYDGLTRLLYGEPDA